jgi:hypothetical protein
MHSCRHARPFIHSESNRSPRGMEQMTNGQQRVLTFFAKCSLALASLVFVTIFTLICLKWSM